MTSGPVIALLVVATATIAVLSVIFGWGPVPATAVSVVTLIWFLISSFKASYAVWLDEYKSRKSAGEKLAAELDKAKPKIVLTFKRLTIDTEKREVVQNPRLMAWVLARNDGRGSKLRNWHMLLRTDGEPVYLGPDPYQIAPGERVVEYTFTDTQEVGKELNHSRNEEMERVTEAAITETDSPEGFILGRFQGEISLEELRKRVYLQCQDIMDQTWRTEGIEGVHPGKVHVIGVSGQRLP